MKLEIKPLPDGAAMVVYRMLCRAVNFVLGIGEKRAVDAAAAAIANERAQRRGAPAISNVLDVLPDKLAAEVTLEADAALRAAFKTEEIECSKPEMAP